MADCCQRFVRYLGLPAGLDLLSIKIVFAINLAARARREPPPTCRFTGGK
jgi:hypothetical protein